MKIKKANLRFIQKIVNRNQIEKEKLTICYKLKLLLQKKMSIKVARRMVFGA